MTNKLDQKAPPAIMREDQEILLNRLVKGQAWLTKTHRQLLKRSDLGNGSDEEAQFLDALEAWDTFDYRLRELYAYEGCVIGQGCNCPKESPVSCRSCGSMTSYGQGHLLPGTLAVGGTPKRENMAQ